MKYVADYSNGASEIDRINNAFRGTEPLFESKLTLFNFKKEALMLNEVEACIPENISFDTHFDIAIKQSSQTLTEYYKTLFSGKNQLFEGNTLSSDQKTMLLEAISKFKEKIHEKLNEQIATNISPNVNNLNGNLFGGTSQIPTNDEFDKALSLEGGEKTDSGIFSVLKSLWNAITEDGSAWGILHLILDVIGLIGDLIMAGTGIPIGVIADLFNGLLYLYRGKTTLAIISFIAAVVVGAGDILKLFKGVSRYADDALYIAAKGGGEVKGAVINAMRKAPAKHQGMLARFFNYLGKTIGPALGKVAGFLSSFFDNFLTKAIGYIPFIGKPLSNFLRGIGTYLAKFSDNMAGFAKIVPDALKEADAALINTFMKNSTDALNTGGTIEKIGGDLVVKKEGQEISRISAKTLEEAGTLTKKFPESSPMGQYFKTADGGETIANYYKSISSLSKKSDDLYDLKKTIAIGKRIISLHPKALVFYSKQIVKALGLLDKNGNSTLSDAEQKVMGHAAIWNEMDRRIQDDLKKHPGQIYSAPVIDDMSDPEDRKTFQVIIDQQNYYAKKFGLPSIIPVTYNLAKETGETIPVEAEELMTSLYDKDEMKKMEANFKSKHPSEELKESFKYVRKYSSF